MFMKRKQFPKSKRVVNVRLVAITFVFAITSTLGNLLLFVASSYAEPTVQDVTYTTAGHINGCGIMQGGATDGQYLYFACASADSSKIRIVKVTTSGEIIKRSDAFSRSKLGHANDMTYNSKLGLLVVSTWDHGGGSLALIDPTDFSLKGTKHTNDGQSTSNICYNASTDQYVIGGKIYNSDFKYQNKRLFTPAGVDDDANTTEGKVLNQGIECNSQYIYVMRVVWGQHGYNMVATYDWNGNNVGLYKINLNDEGENMSIVGSSLYMGVNEGSMSSGGSSLNDYFIKLDGINPSGTTASSTPSFKVATYNIRATQLDSWSKDSRGDKILDYLKTVDVAGVQEVRDDSRAALKKGLSAAGYAKSDANVAVDIFWKTSMFAVTDQGSTAVLDHVNCGTESDVFKALVWVKLTEKTSGIAFYFLTTHLDVNTNDCRVTQINNVLDAVKSTMTDAPVIFVGDMNANSGEDPTNAIASSGFSDAYDTATQKININSSSTLSGIGGQRRNGSPIDHIYTKGSVNVSQIEIKDQAGSDHLPVEAILSIVGKNQGNCHNPNNEQFSDWNINLYDPSCVSTCTETTGTMSGDTNLKKIATYLASKGFNAVAIAGIVGNWRIESTSSLTPFVQQFGSPWPTAGYGLAQWTGSRRTDPEHSTGVVDNLKKDDRTKNYFAQYYVDKYSGRTGDSGVPDGVPTEVNDAWLQVELDFMLQEFTQAQYTIGKGYTSLLKETVPYVTNGDDLKTALNGAKSAGDAAMIFSLIFEKQGDLSTAKSVRAPQAEKDLETIQNVIGLNSTTTANTSTGSCASTASIAGLPDGGVKDTAEGRKQAWQIAQLFIDDLNKKYPQLNAPAVNVNADYSDTSVNTPGTNVADTYSCWAGASRCGQCYALTAWFVYKFTTVEMGTTTDGGDGVVNFMKNKGVSTGDVAKVYSVFSYGEAEGGGGSHTGVVVGIDGDYAITIENNWGPGGRVTVRKHKKDGAEFRDTGAGKTVFAYVAENFRETPKELD